MASAAKTTTTTNIPFGPIGWVTFKRTYARLIDPNNPELGTEEFEQTIDRVIRACNTQLHCGFSETEQERLRFLFLKLKGSVGGRFLWQLGTSTVDRYGLLSLQNCACGAIRDPIRFYQWMFDALMLGCGVGYSVEEKYIKECPVIHHALITHVQDRGADFLVPDSREGWIKLLGKVMKSHFVADDDLHRPRNFTYDTSCVRPAGRPIRGFGGISSGDTMLVEGMRKINNLLNQHAGERPSAVLLSDIANIVAEIVRSGNVRRSSQIALGDANDEAFLHAKRWDIGAVPAYRAMANFSVNVASYEDVPDAVWEGYHGNGECYGFVNVQQLRAFGRTGETQYEDPLVVGVNPCGEQGLEDMETCCLAELFLSNCDTYEETWEIAQFLYRICKHSLALPCHWPETQEVVRRNMRMGIGVTGYQQCSEEQRTWLPRIYVQLRDFDIAYSRAHGWPVSKKLTTVKPSGTLSLLPGVTAGWHPAYAEYYLKRMRFPAEHPLVEEARRRGYHVEQRESHEVDGEGNAYYAPDYTTVIVDFPVTHGKDAITAEHMTITQKLECVARLQRDWSDNAVSGTVIYRKEELAEIRAWLKAHWTEFKTISFMLMSGHGFHQAPWTKITREEYDRRCARILRPFGTGAVENLPESVESEVDASFECIGASCPVR
jgi:ribonucleoside-triphosphate reductase